jgi:hypothetical protein
MCLYFFLWVATVAANFVYPFGHVGILIYSSFLCAHPLVIVFVLWRGTIILLINIFIAFKMNIHTFERSGLRKKDDKKGVL